MGHWCRICGRTKSNENFSGKGHKSHICKECSRKPGEEIREIAQTEDQIFGKRQQGPAFKT